MFRGCLLAPFAAIHDVRSLLQYQEETLEKPLGLLPADWACFECLYLEDYKGALRYAALWQDLKKAELAEYRRASEAEVAARDCTERERKYLRKDMEYRCRCRDHELFAIQRLIYMIETGLYRLIQENLAEYISAAGAAFEQNYPQYRTKE